MKNPALLFSLFALACCGYVLYSVQAGHQPLLPTKGIPNAATQVLQTSPVIQDQPPESPHVHASAPDTRTTEADTTTELPQRRLVGVVHSDAAAANNRALIELPDGKQSLFKLNDELPPDQAVLEEIHPDRVELRTPDQELITLFRQGSQGEDVTDNENDAEPATQAASLSTSGDHARIDTLASTDCTGTDCPGASTQPDLQARSLERNCDEEINGRKAGACEAAIRRQAGTESPESGTSDPAIGSFPGADQDVPGERSADNSASARSAPSPSSTSAGADDQGYQRQESGQTGSQNNGRGI